MRKYTLSIALISILIGTKIQAAGENFGLGPAGASMFMTVVYSVIIGLIIAAGVYAFGYYRNKKQKGKK